MVIKVKQRGNRKNQKHDSEWQTAHVDTNRWIWISARGICQVLRNEDSRCEERGLPEVVSAFEYENEGGH